MGSDHPTIEKKGDTRVPTTYKITFIYRAGSAVCQNRLTM